MAACRADSTSGDAHDASAQPDAVVASGVRVNEQGVITVDGAPFFPIGAYIISWQMDASTQIAELRMLQDAGFNTVQIGLSDSPLQVLDEAYGLGLMVVAEGGYEQLVIGLREHPALLAWLIRDEPALNDVPPEDVLAKHQDFKTWDPSHPTLVVMTVPDSYYLYAAISDIFGIDPYINQRSATPISYVGSCTQLAAQRRNALWVVPHAFEELIDPLNPRFPLPTPAQERSIVYQAVVNGARGLNFFAFDCPPCEGWYMPDHPEFFDMVKVLVAEMNTLGPILARATVRQNVATTYEDIMASHVQSEGSRYLLVVSTTDEILSHVHLPLSEAGQETASAIVMFEDRVVPVEGEYVIDDFAPYASHVYLY